MTKKFYIGTVILLATAALVLVSLCLGTVTISPLQIAGVLRGEDIGPAGNILLNMRVPRVLMALVIGASLSVSGTIFQALLRNSLADPFIIGVSSGAAFGATLSIIFSFPYTVTVLFAFGGSIATVLTVFTISRRLKMGTSSMILSGIALSFILSSAVMLLFSMTRSEQVHRALMWLMGDLGTARFDMIGEMGIVSIVIIFISFMFKRHLDIISFGERFSRNLGVTEGVMILLFWIASLLSALSVSLAGVIGFVGLVVPHVVRRIFGPGHVWLLPVSAVAGAIFLMVSDTAGRIIAPPYEIPVGIITGFCGGIFFLLFLLRKGDNSL